MDKLKKTEVITFRTDKTIKDYLEETAKINKWSIAQVVSAILQNFMLNPEPGEITISTEKFKQVFEEVLEEKTSKVMQINILLEENEIGYYRKELQLSTLECGGRGICSDFERIPELTQDEIYEIDGIGKEEDSIKQFQEFEKMWEMINSKIKRKCENCQKFPICLQNNSTKEKACDEWFLSAKEWEELIIKSTADGQKQENPASSEQDHTG